MAGPKACFDTNNADHHHFITEDKTKIIDIPSAELVVGVPTAPEGYEVMTVNVVVRLRPSQKIAP